MRTQSTTPAPIPTQAGAPSFAPAPAAPADPAPTAGARRRIGLGSGAGKPPARAELAAPQAGERPARRAPAAAPVSLVRAVANSGAAVAAVIVVQGFVDTAFPPTLRQAAGRTVTALQRESPGAAQARSALQGSLEALQDLPADARQDQVRGAQKQAHDHLRAYAGTTSSYAEDRKFKRPVSRPLPAPHGT